MLPPWQCKDSLCEMWCVKTKQSKTKLNKKMEDILIFSSLGFLKDLFIILERESARACAHRSGKGGTKGKGERESQADSTRSTEPNAGLSLRTLRSWPELKSRSDVQLTEPPKRPSSLGFLKFLIDFSFSFCFVWATKALSHFHREPRTSKRENICNQ